MRKITVCELKEIRKPGKRDTWHEHHVYRMLPGTAWKIDVYGKHEVVEVDEKITKKSEGWCLQHFDGRNMIVFEVDGTEYMQPCEEDSRATDDRLGKKRKIRKARAPRREAPGVAKAINPENDGPPPSEEDAPRRPKRAAALAPGEVKPYRRAGPRRGLTLA